jgi:hypothetical protein
MTRAIALGGLVLGLSLVGYAVFARETDEEKILGVLRRLESAVHVDGDTASNPLIRAATLRREFGGVFDANVRYRIPELTGSSSGVESLVILAVQSTTGLTTLDLSFSRPDIKLVPPAGATATTTARVRGFRGTEPYEEAERRVRFELT